MTSNPAGNAGNPAPNLNTSEILDALADLLKKASPDELGQAGLLLEKEIDRRIAEADQAAENVRKSLGRPKTQSDTISTSISTGKKASSKGKRTPKGEAQKLILAFIQDGPKFRKQIIEHGVAKGLTKSSINSLLSRMKKKKELIQEGESIQINPN